MLNEFTKQAMAEADARAEIVLRLRKSWYSYADITKETWITKRLISKYLNKKWYVKVVKPFTEEEKAESLRLYWEMKSTKEIAVELGKDPTTISDYLISKWLETDIRKRKKDYYNDIIKNSYIKWDTCSSLVDKTWISFDIIKKRLKENGLTRAVIWYKVCDCWFSWKTIEFCWKSCKKCHYKDKHKANYKSTWEMSIDDFCAYKLKSIKASARNRWLDFDLDIDYIKLLMSKANWFCVYSLREFWLDKSSISFDRFDNDLWYIKGNVVPSSIRINEKKWDFSIEELKEYMPIIYERWLSFLKTLL